MIRLRPLALGLLWWAAPLLSLSIVLLGLSRETGQTLSLAQAAPLWSDEIFYWHQAQTFAVAGLEGGYYTVNEQPAAAGWSRFYAWGAFVPIAQGLWARLVGDGLGVIVGLHLGVLALASLSCAWAWKERAPWGMALLLAVFWPLIFALPTSQQEAFHAAVALALGGVLLRLLDGTATRPLLALGLAWLVIGSLSRPTWGVLLLPLMFLSGPRGLARLMGATLAALLFSLAAFALVDGTAAYYPTYRSVQMAVYEGGPLEKLLRYGLHSLELFITTGPPLSLLVRGLVVGLGALGLLSAAAALRRRAAPWEGLLHAYNLLGLLGLLLFVHQTIDSHDVRVLAPHLLLSLVVLAGLRLRWGVLACCIMLLALPWAWQDARWLAFNTDGRSAAAQAAWRAPLQAALAYDESRRAEPWCNTLTTSFFYLYDLEHGPGLLLAVPPGLGISYLFPDGPAPERLAARYLMLTDEDAQRWGEGQRLETLAQVAGGALYLNRDSACQD